MLAKMACETQDSCSVYTSQLQWWKAQHSQTVFPHGPRPQTALSEAVESSSDRFREVRRRHGPTLPCSHMEAECSWQWVLPVSPLAQLWFCYCSLTLAMKTSHVGLGFPQTPPFVPSVTYHIPRHIILGKQHQSTCTCVGMHIHVRTYIICAYVFM